MPGSGIRVYGGEGTSLITCTETHERCAWRHTIRQSRGMCEAQTHARASQRVRGSCTRARCCTKNNPRHPSKYVRIYLCGLIRSLKVSEALQSSLNQCSAVEEGLLVRLPKPFLGCQLSTVPGFPVHVARTTSTTSPSPIQPAPSPSSSASAVRITSISRIDMTLGAPPPKIAVRPEKMP